jgi:predicted TPR repeat methyltransferase
MLDRAAQKTTYDRLVKAEIGVFLAGSTQQYDLVACMDTLIYFGALEDIVMLMARNLKPGGWLIFSTEKLIADGSDDVQRRYSLNISGRYSHSEIYLRDLLQANGFELHYLHDLTIRTEAGVPIPGQIVRARKLSSS